MNRTDSKLTLSEAKRKVLLEEQVLTLSEAKRKVLLEEQVLTLSEAKRKVLLEEQVLIADYLKKGDEKSLEVLFTRYIKPIYRFVYGYTGNAQDAEDITQDAFVKAWRSLKRFDLQKSFKAWLFSIAKNSAIDFLKKKKSIPFSAFDTDQGGNILFDTLADSSPSPQELFERAGVSKTISLAMEKLSDTYRAVLSLRYNDQLSFREIAEVLKESLHTVKSRHRRALILLKKVFPEACKP
ncbi:MAG: sigma-70 family RNA polymerase sigma factor [Candidatus Portnoybacteria bacterium]|nr:sigma-70 family RNA polymerase sigma factor [Candidatus Portnoybacteria bacterium]